jgi:predicted lipoprotein with Yx(FWY)xxD motif
MAATHTRNSASFLTACAVALFGLPAAAADLSVPAAPPGVTFQMNFKSLPGAGGGGDGLTLVYANAAGHSLYTFDKDTAGQSSCSGECAAAWPPFAAAPTAMPVGAWSLITRADGAKQWALHGKALYLSTKDEKPAEMKGVGTEGWHLASIEPGAGITFPFDIAARELADAGGQALVSSLNLTLYIHDGDKGGKSACVGECTALWQPYAAGAISNPVGDFSLIARPDGIKQWAYKKQPLYTNINDEQPGEIHGHNAAPQWHVALITRYYMPPDVVVTKNARHGSIMALKSGQTLYAEDIVRFTGGGVPHANRIIARGISMYGRQINTNCIDACTETRKPFLAPADAMAAGYWSIVTRPDGARQWAYLDFPLYTYTGDKKPGDARGHDVADIGAKVKGDDMPFTAAPVGLYWRVALP